MVILGVSSEIRDPRNDEQRLDSIGRSSAIHVMSHASRIVVVMFISEAESGEEAVGPTMRVAAEGASHEGWRLLNGALGLGSNNENGRKGGIGSHPVSIQTYVHLTNISPSP